MELVPRAPHRAVAYDMVGVTTIEIEAIVGRLMKSRRYALVPLNLSSRLTVGSRTYGWEEEVVGPGSDSGCDSVGCGFLEVPDCNSLNDS